ncbi:zinc finger protein 341-like [Lineus longissimus]|uniref:zinc finger protein 341-like n=1 Tax=Lineus longissimus TaxID=88925 RepID=UPI002B4C9267
MAAQGVCAHTGTYVLFAPRTMAQALFEVLTGGVSSVSVDNQTTLAVQSLLESQTIQEQPPVDDDDVFQCGKCKKQFTSLSVFVSHKQQRCAQLVQQPPSSRPGPLMPPGSITANPNSAFTSSVPSNLTRHSQLQSYNSVTASPIPQSISQGIVLSEDLITFANIDQLQTQNLQMVQGTQIQGNPFLSQVGPLTPRSTSANGLGHQNITTYTVSAPVLQTSFANQAAYNTAQQPTHQVVQSPPYPSGIMAATQQEFHQIPQTVTMGTIQKHSQGKHGKKSVAINPNQNISVMMLTEQDVSGGIIVNQLPPGGKQRRLKAMSPEEASKRKLKCQYCEKSFAKNFDLQQHVRSHTGEKPFQCIVCGRAFAQKSNVKKHMQTHKVWPTGNTGTLPKMPIIEKVDLDGEEGEVSLMERDKEPNPDVEEAELKEDLFTVISQQKDTAELSGEPMTGHELECEEEPGDSGNKVSIMIDNTYLCHYCPEKFKSYFQLKTHMVIHKSEQVYKCIVKKCGETYKELDQFLEHTKTHETDMCYRCHLCNKNFPSLYELGVHQYSHSLYPSQGAKAGARFFKCNKCNNKYATPEALEHHMSTTTHNYPCPNCDKIFSCERYLRRHLVTHSSADLTCSVCGKGFRTDHYLKMHMLIHSNTKPFKCEQCGTSFNRKDKLKRHETIHDPSKRFKCPFRSHTGCMKEFNRPDKLKAHIITHSGVKPYKCLDCGKTFTRRPHLRDHERMHKDDYKWRCDDCGRGFARERLLTVHKCRSKQDGVDEDAEVVEKPQPKAPVPKPKTSKRRIARAPKKMIKVTKESVSLNRRSGRGRRRVRPRRIYALDSESEDETEMEAMLAKSPSPVPETAEEADDTERMVHIMNVKTEADQAPMEQMEHKVSISELNAMNTINLPGDGKGPVTIGIKSPAVDGVYEVQVFTQTNADGNIVQQIQPLQPMTYDVSHLSGQAVQLTHSVPLSATMEQAVQDCISSPENVVLGMVAVEAPILQGQQQ